MEFGYSFGVNKPIVLPSRLVKRPNQPAFGISVFSSIFLAKFDCFFEHCIDVVNLDVYDYLAWRDLVFSVQSSAS